MPLPPKRRGRPPGSKNRATTDGPTMIPLGSPVPYDQAGYVSAIAGPEPIKVTLAHKGRAFGDPAMNEEIEWPPEWRLPQAGEAIFLSEKWGGVVQLVEFWCGSGERRIILRLV